MYSDHVPSLRISSVLFGHTIGVVVPHHLISYLVQPILNTGYRNPRLVERCLRLCSP